MDAELGLSHVRPATATVNSSHNRGILGADKSYHVSFSRKPPIPVVETKESIDICITPCTSQVYADDCNVMAKLMKRVEPILPPRADIAATSASVYSSDKIETESQQYIKNLERAIEEGLGKKRKAHNKRFGSNKTNDKKALDVWIEEEQQKGYTDSESYVFCKSRSLINAVEKGRFPLDANAPLSEVVRKWKRGKKNEKEKKQNHNEAFVTSLEVPQTRITLLERLKREPVRNWRTIHNLTTPPTPLQKSIRSSHNNTNSNNNNNNNNNNNTRPSSSNISSNISRTENWRHTFDYVNYSDKFRMDETLAMRDLCRQMVIRHEVNSSLEPPLIALSEIFMKNSSRFAEEKHRSRPTRKEEPILSSIWMRRANEISLEKERQRFINYIQDFELRVAAASLSKEVVSDLRDDLIKLLQKWPCDYRKSHVFTKINFIEWVRARYKLPETVGNDDAESSSLAESMASSAEAAFIDHVLAILPDDWNIRSSQTAESIIS